ncbi:MAG: glycosyltransferase family 4 protein [Chthonomonadales bacterium]
MARTVWAVSEIYYPDDNSTGYFLSKIAEGLAEENRVRVLCGQPSYSARGTRAPIKETHNGVEIERCSGTTFPKDNLPLRLVNALTVSMAIFFKALTRIKKGDPVIVVTNPPPLPFIIGIVCWVKGAKLCLLIQDVYPEVLVATGLTTETSLISRMVGSINRKLYRTATRVIALGRDMESLVYQKLGNKSDRVVIIPNWADHNDVKPGDRNDNALLKELGMENNFVIQYSGNMGRTHGLEYVMAAAEKLSSDTRFKFLFIGSGAKKKFVEEKSKELPNVTVLGYRPRAELQTSLNACDVSIITFVPGMAGVSVPSRMYNVMATGKPIIAVADPHSELALVVKEENIGWLVPPNNTEALIAALKDAASDPDRLVEMGKRSRKVIEEKYTFAVVDGLYKKMIKSIP